MSFLPQRMNSDKFVLPLKFSSVACFNENFQQFPSFCYKTCNTCNSLISYKTCDHSSCYDDVKFARAVIDYVADNYCLDMNRVVKRDLDMQENMYRVAICTCLT